MSKQDGRTQPNEKYTLTERVLGQIKGMREEATLQGAGHFEPFFKDVETLCGMAAENEKLAKFKAYVHRRLDDAGIPVDPKSPHKGDGCRIGGRLDIILKSHRHLLAACKLALYTIEECPDMMSGLVPETLEKAIKIAEAK